MRKNKKRHWLSFDMKRYIFKLSIISLLFFSLFIPVIGLSIFSYQLDELSSYIKKSGLVIDSDTHHYSFIASNRIIETSIPREDGLPPNTLTLDINAAYFPFSVGSNTLISFSGDISVNGQSIKADLDETALFSGAVDFILNTHISMIADNAEFTTSDNLTRFHFVSPSYYYNSNLDGQLVQNASIRYLSMKNDLIDVSASGFIFSSSSYLDTPLISDISLELIEASVFHSGDDLSFNDLYLLSTSENSNDLFSSGLSLSVSGIRSEQANLEPSSIDLDMTFAQLDYPSLSDYYEILQSYEASDVSSDELMKASITYLPQILTPNPSFSINRFNLTRGQSHVSLTSRSSLQNVTPRDFNKGFPLDKLKSYTRLEFDHSFPTYIAGLLRATYPARDVPEILDRLYETGVLLKPPTPDSSLLTLDIRDQMFRFNNFHYLPLDEIPKHFMQISSHLAEQFSPSNP